MGADRYGDVPSEILSAVALNRTRRSRTGEGLRAKRPRARELSDRLPLFGPI